MPAISELLTKVDNVELVRDRIAEIIKGESDNQVALAEAAALDDSTINPDLWKLSVYRERCQPWAKWIERPETDARPCFEAPIVNVSMQTGVTDKSASTYFDKQRFGWSFNIDVFGYGVAHGKEGPGHVPGDLAAALACQRAVRLVRNILMAGHYTRLGFPSGAQQFVSSRWISNIGYQQPQIDDRPVEQVLACRIALDVDMNEFSPQYIPEPLEWIGFTLKWTPDGELVKTVAEIGFDVGEPGDGTAP